MKLERLIELLKLEPHPAEGGYFRETYRSAEEIQTAAIPPRYRSSRSFGTAIYYLITPDSYSLMHRVASDEVFHFYLGDPVEMLQLHPDGSARRIRLGQNIEKGEEPQVVVPKGVWQGSLLAPGGDFALLGATVAPGFDYADFEIGRRTALCEAYPEHADLINRLTK